MRRWHWTYIHQREEWPGFTWDDQELIGLLGSVRALQGKMVGQMEALGFDLKAEATLTTLSLDVLKSSEIEGEILNPDQVRSSLARRLGMEIQGLVPSDKDVDGVVDMMLDATRNHEQALTKERLFGWHSALFPTGRSGMYKIVVGDWRDDSTGPMQVVSGAMGKERVHFVAPPAVVLEEEMERFFRWFNAEQDLDPVLKAGVAHLWFVTLHPFEDGNGRIARALADLMLARADGIPQRFYSMSAEIRRRRKYYYLILEKTQKGNLNITDWLLWFLKCLHGALLSSDKVLGKVIFKHHFWNRNATRLQNERQKKLLNMLMDGFHGKLNTSKWAKIAKCSTDTALRDIQDLVRKGILEKAPGGGRSTSYQLVGRDELQQQG